MCSSMDDVAMNTAKPHHIDNPTFSMLVVVVGLNTVILDSRQVELTTFPGRDSVKAALVRTRASD